MLKNIEYRNIMENELLVDETIVWEGKPNYKVFSSADIFLIPMSIIWLVVALMWEVIALISTHFEQNRTFIDIIFPIIGIPMILIGIYFSIGRFIFKKIKWGN